MIKRVIASLMFVFLVLALVLKLAGVTPDLFSTGYRAYLRSVANQFNTLKDLRIPIIPTFNVSFDNIAWYEAVVEVLKAICNFFVGICNMAISITNFIDELLLFLVSCFTAIFSFKDYFITL